MTWRILHIITTYERIIDGNEVIMRRIKMYLIRPCIMGINGRAQFYNGIARHWLTTGV